ncbi:hypothetical protein ACHAXT_012362 [Thalassiosira profunda]
MSNNRRRSSGGGNNPPDAAWMHQHAQMMANANNMTPQQQAQMMANANMTQQRQQQAANASAANMQGLNQGLNIAHLTPQQQQKLQMMQLHDRLKQQGGGGDLGDNVNPAGGNNVVNPGNSGVPAQQQQQQLAQQQQLQQQQQQLQQHHAQQMQQMQQLQQRRHSQQAVQQANSRMQPNIGQRGNVVQQQPNNIGQGGNTNPNQVMQMMQMQGQPQQLTQSQQQQLIQNIQMQQQQIRQLQMAQPQGKMAQALQGQMQIGGRMIQALEEQKVRYSSQLQQFHGPNSDGQLQQIQEGQISRSASVTSHHTDPRGAGTPLSPSMRSTSSRPSSSRPSSARPSSTQPMIPPSRPPSQISQASAHSTSPQHATMFQAQANALNLNSSYLPISTAKTNKPSSMSRGASSASSSSHHVAFSTSVSTYSQPSLPSDLPAQGAMASAPGTAQTSEQAKDVPKQSTAFASKGKGKKTQRRNSVPHNSSLSYEEVADLANACTTEEKIVFVAKQVLSGGNANGFHKATAAMQRMKKQRMRAVKQKGEGGSSKKDEKPEDDEERIKRETFNVRMAKRMQSDMIEGLQFTNLMTDVIRSILEDIDPDNPLLLVQPPMIGTEADFASMPSSLPTLPADEIASAASTSSANAPHSPKQAGTANQTVAEGTHGSTLRKLRKRSDGPSLASDDSLRKMVGTEDEDGNKLPKKEVSHRMLEAHRFRTLLAGDHVAAKLSSQDLWILARVAKQYKAVASHQQLAGLKASKRDALFQEKVYIQDSDDYSGDVDNASPVLRQHVLPLPRTYGEASQWGSRIRKGYRVYALYPDTTTLYCGTVVDSTTYCRDQDDIIVVQFDGDEDDNGELPERHIPARFVTLIPREFPASTKKRRKSTSDGGGKRPKHELASSHFG